MWTGAIDGHGYGQVWDFSARRHRRTNRVAWELTRGPLPEGAVILHICDTPACVRPTHLRAGDQALNMQDAAQKGRTNKGPGKVYGDRHHQTKIPDAEIEAIIRRRAAGERPTDLAREYGVSYNTIRAITLGRRRVSG